MTSKVIKKFPIQGDFISDHLYLEHNAKAKMLEMDVITGRCSNIYLLVQSCLLCPDFTQFSDLFHQQMVTSKVLATDLWCSGPASGSMIIKTQLEFPIPMKICLQNSCSLKKIFCFLSFEFDFTAK